MIDIICTKDGRAYMPKANVFDAEYFILHKMLELVDKTEKYEPALNARIELDFSDRDVRIKAVNCYENFTSSFHKPRIQAMLSKAQN